MKQGGKELTNVGESKMTLPGSRGLRVLPKGTLLPEASPFDTAWSSTQGGSLSPELLQSPLGSLLAMSSEDH